MKIMHEKGRFYAKTENGVAELLYRINGKVMPIYHTFVPEMDRGHGIAEKLAVVAFEFAKKNGLKVKPDCPYITHFLKMHKELQKYAI